MSKSPDFYKNYIPALFRRGKAEKLPMSYLTQEAERVLNPDEMKLFHQELENMIQNGDVLRDEDMLRLHKADA